MPIRSAANLLAKSVPDQLVTADEQRQLHQVRPGVRVAVRFAAEYQNLRHERD